MTTSAVPQCTKLQMPDSLFIASYGGGDEMRLAQRYSASRIVSNISARVSTYYCVHITRCVTMGTDPVLFEGLARFVASWLEQLEDYSVERHQCTMDSL